MQKVHTRCADIRNISESHYNLSKIELILNKANAYLSYYVAHTCACVSIYSLFSLIYCSICGRRIGKSFCTISQTIGIWME